MKPRTVRGPATTATIERLWPSGYYAVTGMLHGYLRRSTHDYLDDAKRAANALAAGRLDDFPYPGRSVPR